MSDMSLVYLTLYLFLHLVEDQSAFGKPIRHNLTLPFYRIFTTYFPHMSDSIRRTDISRLIGASTLRKNWDLKHEFSMPVMS